MQNTDNKDGFGIAEKRHQVNKEEQDRIIRILSHHLSQCSEIRFAYLHGSFLGELPYKDVDIAVFYSEKVPPDQQLDLCLSLAAELSHKLKVTVDIHSLNRTAVAFRYQATRGRVLLAKDREELFNFVEATWREYLDIMPLLKENLADMVKT